jgi:hypothetical protein
MSADSDQTELAELFENVTGTDTVTMPQQTDSPSKQPAEEGTEARVPDTSNDAGLDDDRFAPQ